jgi:hypothetical protein
LMEEEPGVSQARPMDAIYLISIQTPLR